MKKRLSQNNQPSFDGENLTDFSHLARMALGLVPKTQASLTSVSTDALLLPHSKSETNETANPAWVAV